jgi:hypothetical protein
MHEGHLPKLFKTLPFELEKYEIKSHLDEVSLMLLEYTFFKKALPTKLTYQ